MKKNILLLLLSLSLQADAGKLIKIVDGDTLYFSSNGNKIKCRIKYIDTPESRINNKLKKDIRGCKNISIEDMIYAGKAATQEAEKQFTLYNEYNFIKNSKDRYGRYICNVESNNGNYSEHMILSGYAIPFFNYMNNKEKEYFFKLLKKAKSSKNGLWQKAEASIECLKYKRLQ